MPCLQPSRAHAPADSTPVCGPALPDLADLDNATAAVFADPDATAAERITAAEREEAVFLAFARRLGGADLLRAGV